MIALLSLYKVTLENKYLNAAINIAEFILTTRNDDGTYQGFQGGFENPENPTSIPRIYASAEHNIDIYAAFIVLFEITGENIWNEAAEHARKFVESVFDPNKGCFYAGSENPEKLNTIPGQLPVDVQAWSLLAHIPLAEANAEIILMCAELNHLSTSDGFGIAAASHDELSTGFGFMYFRRLHIAATAWSIFSQLNLNPYYLE